MNHDSYADGDIRDILTSMKTIVMVGASANTARPSYIVLKYLSERGFTMLPINPGLAGLRDPCRLSPTDGHGRRLPPV